MLMQAIQENYINSYLTNMPTDIVNQYGLSKVLLTRRETIYLKHVLKNVFMYGTEDELKEKLDMMQFKSLFQYFTFVTDKLRAIYKLPREYQVENADDIIKRKRNSFFKTLELYKDLKPIIILDFDKTITNKKFHSLYNYIIDDYHIVINSANPNLEAIEEYLDKYNLKRPKQIYANKGKKKKIVNLKQLALRHIGKIIFYIDDEIEYLDYGCLLFMYCYRYTKSGKIYNHTIFKK
jgi:hypothetical protein